MTPTRRLGRAAGAVTLAVAAAACAGDADRVEGPQSFCDRLRDARVELVAVGVGDPASAVATAERLGELASVAPADIHEEWRQLTEFFRTVGTLDPTDPGFRAAVLAEVGRTVTAAAEVTSWVQQRCGLDLTTESLAVLTPAPSPTSAPPATVTPAPPTETPGAGPTPSTSPAGTGVTAAETTAPTPTEPSGVSTTAPPGGSPSTVVIHPVPLRR